VSVSAQIAERAALLPTLAAQSHNTLFGQTSTCGEHYLGRRTLLIWPANVLQRLLGLKPHESRLAARLFFISFFIGVALVSFDLAVSTALVVELGPGELIVARSVPVAAAPLTGMVLLWLRPRLSFTAMALGPLSVVVLALLGLVLCLWQATPGLSYLMVLRAFSYVLDALAVTSFWAVTARLLDIEQSTRIYALVSAGEVVAGLLGGVAAAPLLYLLSLPGLLLLTTGGFCIATVLLIRVTRQASGSLSGPATQSEEVASAGVGSQGLLRQLRSVLRNPHARRLMTYYVWADIATTLIELTLSLSLQHAEASPTVVAATLGWLLAAQLLLTTALRVFLAGRLLRRYGVGFGLASAPLAVLAVAALALATNPFVPSLLAAAVALSGSKAIVSGVLQKPAFMAAFRPMATEPREQTLLLIETVVDPATTCLPGLALLLLPAAALQGTALLWLLLPGVLVWSSSARSLARSYQHLLAPTQREEVKKGRNIMASIES
jgi:AAA family ATP:ADP antiporter